ncbi:SGNH/GDSL hydrolase family protein [Candidatus Poribacteria bacterium]|nr:SGNH/GDSL hydrolase family protein [Candidatus Poribacteria bacterium]
MKNTPKVLLLGDSIRMSYQPIVAKTFQGVVDVVGPADNCQYSLYTLASLERWLKQPGNPDIVHWNNGIHDSGHNPARSPRQIPIEIYRLTLEFILQRLQETGAQIIWATTTPVHPSRLFVDNQWSWRNEEIDQYNSVALDLMKSRGIPLNDLHSIVMSDVDRYLSEDMLHLSEAGQERCAEAVVAAIKKYLPCVST